MSRFLLLSALALSSGCSSRYLLSVQDGPSDAGARTTVLTTLDTKNYVVVAWAKYVFWECQEEGDGIVCEKRCDVKDDQGEKVECQKFQVLPY